MEYLAILVYSAQAVSNEASYFDWSKSPTLS